ncbi:MAG TPA: hypothetical protein DCL35_08255 [Candidatus Omnitrophica bacterium]|nr:hypothetical protein [Candidatus Omnitrophota bacterium]
MEEAKKKHKRKTYFIEKKFQAKFILKFCGLVAAGGILTIGVLYFFASQSTTVSILDSRVVVRSTADFLLPALVRTVVAVTVIIGIAAMAVALLVSHKIAGPMYRFKKIAQILADGDFSSEFKIRNLDQLQPLADEFNTMIRKTKQQLNLLKSHFASLKDKIEALPEEEAAEQKRDSLKELKKISRELETIVHYFKS